MPRTKQVRDPAVSKSSVASSGELETYLEDFTAKFNAIKEEIEKESAERLKRFRQAVRQDKLSIPVALGNKKIKELKEGNCSILQNLSCLSSLSLLNTMRSDPSHTNNTMAAKKYSNDEGSSRQSRATKRSSSTSRAATVERTQKYTRTSRSVSRSSTRTSAAVKQTGPRSRSKNKFVTPFNTKKLESFGTVTPKVKPNTPHVILRRPQQGEMALSLQGSPLMTTAMVSETAANLNIPLPDGRLINIQPISGMRRSEIPMLDPETCDQLQTLREAIDKMCQYSKPAP